MPIETDGRVAVMFADWIGHPDTGVDEIAVLAVLALHADRHGVCWPSQALLARLLNRSRPWVNKVINQLCDLGLLVKTHRSRDDGGNRSCLYRLVHPAFTAGQHAAPLCDVAASAPCPAGDSPRPGSDSPCPEPDNRKNPNELKPDSPPTAGAASLARIEPSLQNTPALLPADWQPGDDDLIWAIERFPATDLARHTERFVARCRAKGYLYRDPGAAWRAWLIDDLAHPAPGRPHRSVAPSGPKVPPAYQRYQVWAEVAGVAAAGGAC